MGSWWAGPWFKKTYRVWNDSRSLVTWYRLRRNQFAKLKVRRIRISKNRRIGVITTNYWSRNPWRSNRKNCRAESIRYWSKYSRATCFHAGWGESIRWYCTSWSGWITTPSLFPWGTYNTTLRNCGLRTTCRGWALNRSRRWAINRSRRWATNTN